MVTPADSTRAVISVESCSVICSALPRSEGDAVVGVVRVAGRDVADRGVGLDGHELGEVVDLEDGLRGVPDLPDHDGGELDRVAVGVVHLEHGGLVVAQPGGDLAAAGEGVHPAQAVLPDGALIAAEELADPGLARGDLGEAEEGDQGGDHDEGAHHDEGGPQPLGTVLRLGRAHRDQRDAAGHDEQREQQERQPGHPRRPPLLHPRGGHLRHIGRGRAVRSLGHGGTPFLVML